jgi:hypothetical protein
VASYPEVIPPGQVGSIDAELDTQKLSGPVGRGISVQTNDPRRPKVFLTIHATVVGGVVLLPRPIVMMTNRSAAGFYRSVIVRPEQSDLGKLRVAETEMSVSWLSVIAEEIVEPTKMKDGAPQGIVGDWLISVILEDSAPYGRFTETLTFSTGLRRQPVVELPIVVTMIPPVSLSETRLVLPQVVDDQVPRRTILLTVRRGLDPAALEIESRPAALSAELERSGVRGYKVHVAWDSHDPPQGELTFRVGSEELSVPVFAQPGPS